MSQESKPFNVDVCPLSKFDKSEGYTFCSVKPVGDAGHMPCLCQHECLIYKMILKAYSHGYENGRAYEQLCQQERMRAQ